MLAYVWSFVSNWCGQRHPHVQAHVDCNYSNESSSSSEDLPKARKTWLGRHRPESPDVKKEK